MATRINPVVQENIVLDETLNRSRVLQNALRRSRSYLGGYGGYAGYGGHGAGYGYPYSQGGAGYGGYGGYGHGLGGYGGYGGYGHGWGATGYTLEGIGSDVRAEERLDNKVAETLRKSQQILTDINANRALTQSAYAGYGTGYGAGYGGYGGLGYGAGLGGYGAGTGWSG